MLNAVLRRHRNEVCEVKKRIQERMTQIRTVHSRTLRIARTTSRNEMPNARPTRSTCISASRTEDGATDTNHGGPFLDGHLEVVRHSHGELAETLILHLVADPIPQLAHCGEVSPSLVHIGYRRNGHQSHQAHSWKHRDFSGKVRSSIDADTTLLLLASDIDLDESLNVPIHTL